MVIGFALWRVVPSLSSVESNLKSGEFGGDLVYIWSVTGQNICTLRESGS